MSFFILASLNSARPEFSSALDAGKPQMLGTGFLDTVARCLVH